MLVKNIKNCKTFVAKDGCRLKEVLHPKNDKKITDKKVSLAHAVVLPGKKTRPHKLGFLEIYYILEGRGIIHINNEQKIVKKNCAVYIPKGSVQWTENIGRKKLEFLCICAPPWNNRGEKLIKR